MVAARRVLEKRGHDHSEPEDFLRMGARKNSWALMVGLIGEGQEIYLGEEAGRWRLLKPEAPAAWAHWAAQHVVLSRARSAAATAAPCVLVLSVPSAPLGRDVGLQQPLSQWNDAIRRTSDRWTVHCPQKIANIFDSADRLDINESLDLDMSLRTHLAEDVQGWVEDLLDGRLDAAAGHAEAMEKQGFRLYLTRDLGRATRYVRERYRTEEDKRYGFLGSSKGKLDPFGIPTDYYATQNSLPSGVAPTGCDEHARGKDAGSVRSSATGATEDDASSRSVRTRRPRLRLGASSTRMKIGPWYYDDPDSPGSCCKVAGCSPSAKCL